MRITDRNFYNRNTLQVAKDLLGCKLCKKAGNITQKGTIVETEAYTQDDPACHAYKGMTKRAATLFKMPGIAYVYFIYGMYYCVNVVTEQEGVAGAVLIRALEPLENIENTNGPGKLCREMGINKLHNEIDLTHPDSELWIEKGEPLSEDRIFTTTRIGIKQAADYPWRFYIKDNPYVSRK